MLELAPVRDVIGALIDHVAEALEGAGDREIVEEAFEHLVARGNGAGRQRAIYEAKGDLKAVVKDLRERTESSWSA